jgi:hypothetical protein
VVSSRPPRRQKTKEKLKNPQELDTQALESQEGLKLSLASTADDLLQHMSPESQEGLKPILKIPNLISVAAVPPESQEGLKLHVAACAVHYLAVHHVESQEGLKRLCEHAWLEIVP